ncbi:hypothetical protein [Okeania sp. KiyG1]|nr:hypothetical protein [Okeania sp. KiyG1]
MISYPLEKLWYDYQDEPLSIRCVETENQIYVRDKPQLITG